MQEVVNWLIKCNKTVSVMESCTGGMMASEITNISDASKVFSFGAVTYSNEAKIKMGVSKSVIDKYGVYSKEVAISMAKTIACYANSNYGIGITGKLKKADRANLVGADDLVFFSIYDCDNNDYYTDCIQVSYDNRIDNKVEVINKIVEKMLEILKNHEKTC